uniref:Nephrocystin 3-like N-terminal domain-containing protein n=1 Tax=Mycena chlorophos TaxID=658473 RepID=A0ABQ0LNP1_MYCCL|nr:predicted protein [Mycena chlorophos]
MAFDMCDTHIHGVIGGTGGIGGQRGGEGGIGQGNNVQINTTSVHVYEAQEEDYHKIMDFLSPTNFLHRQQEIYKMRHQDTGSWLLNHPSFLEWKSGPCQLLWCSGIPGAGKTVLACEMGVTCVFLNYKESGSQTLENVLGAVIRQLALQKDLQPARALYQKHLKQDTSITLAELQTLLEIYAQQFTQVYVILDALDEYLEEDRDQLLEIILGATGNTKLLVTCRPQITPRGDLEYIHLEIEPPDDDIKAYIRARMARSHSLRGLTRDEIMKNGVVESITAKAAGM